MEPVSSAALTLVHAHWRSSFKDLESVSAVEKNVMGLRLEFYGELSLMYSFQSSIVKKTNKQKIVYTYHPAGRRMKQKGLEFKARLG